MGTESILLTAQKHYVDCVREGKVNTTLIRDYLRNVDNISKRVNIIADFYDLILNTSILSKISLQYVRTGKSYSGVAEDYNLEHRKDEDFKAKSTEAVKSDVNYHNKKIERYLGVVSSKNNMLKEMFRIDKVDDRTFKLAEEAMRMLKVHYAENVFSNKNFLLNIPAFSYKRTLDSNKFNIVVDVIRPYIIGQRRLAQDKLNSMKDEVGYLHYIMQKDSRDLNDLDIERRNELLQLFDVEEHERYRVDRKTINKEIKDEILQEIERQEPITEVERDKIRMFDNLIAATLQSNHVEIKNILREIVIKYKQ